MESQGHTEGRKRFEIPIHYDYARNEMEVKESVLRFTLIVLIRKMLEYQRLLTYSLGPIAFSFRDTKHLAVR